MAKTPKPKTTPVPDLPANSVILDYQVTPIDRDTPNFMKDWRRLLYFKRALADFERAQPEDIDEVRALILSHTVYPETIEEQNAILDAVSLNEMLRLLDVIGGRTEIPPANGAV